MQTERTKTSPFGSDASGKPDHAVDDFARIALEQNAAAQLEELGGSNFTYNYIYGYIPHLPPRPCYACSYIYGCCN